MDAVEADSRTTGPTPVDRHRFARIALAVSMFVMGACGLAYEYTLGVLGNNLLGSSHEQLLVVIGLMLFAMGIGAGLQRLIVTDLVDAFLWVELALALLGGASALLVYTAYVFTSSHQLVLYSSALGIGALIGCEIPLLIRIHERWARDLRTNLSTTLALDYVGALAGALFFTYGLLAWLSVPRIATVLGLVNASLAVLGLIAFRGMVVRPATLAVATVAVLGALSFATTRADDWTATLEQRAFADPIVHASTSRYQHIVLTSAQTAEGERLQMFLDGQLQWNSLDECIYHELLAHPPIVLADAPVENVLILGGGDGLGLREVLRHPGVRHVTLVDLDPHVLELGRTQPDLVRLNAGALRDARVHLGGGTILQPVEPDATRSVRVPSFRAVRSGVGADEAPIELAEVEVFALDADTFLREFAEDGAKPFDAALLDFPDPRSVELAKLYTVDFYRSLARRLRPGALIAVQSTSPWHARRVFLSIGATLHAAGYETVPYHANVPSFGEWGWHLARRPTADSPGPAELADRLDAIGATDLPQTLRYLTPQALRAAFVFGKGALLWPEAGETAPVHSKMRPGMHELYRRAWQR